MTSFAQEWNAGQAPLQRCMRICLLLSMPAAVATMSSHNQEGSTPQLSAALLAYPLLSLVQSVTMTTLT